MTKFRTWRYSRHCEMYDARLRVALEPECGGLPGPLGVL